MAWWGWLLLAGSLAGCVWGWRVVFRGMCADMKVESGGDLFANAAMATIMCWLWPAIAVFALAKRRRGWKTPAEAARAMGGQTREEKLAAARRRVTELERDLDIKS